MSGIIALGNAVGNMAAVNADAEEKQATQIVTLILTWAQLGTSYAKLWAEDAWKYFIASIDAASDSASAPKAAAAYAQYQEDEQQGEAELAMQNSSLQNSKEVLKVLGNSMTAIYSMTEGPMNALKAVNSDMKRVNA